MLLFTISIVVINFIITLVVLQEYLYICNIFIYKVVLSYSSFLKDLYGKRIPGFVTYSPISFPHRMSDRENLPTALHPPKILFSVHLFYFYFRD